MTPRVCSTNIITVVFGNYIQCTPLQNIIEHYLIPLALTLLC
jgi:hypothetical protein